MNAVRKPSIALSVIRVIVLTIFSAALGFTVSLFLGICGIVLANMVRGGSINMAEAYRSVALPIAIAVGVVALIVNTIMEIRAYRRKSADRYLRAA